MQETRSPNYPSAAEHAVLGLASLIILEQHSRLPEVSFFVFFMGGAAIGGVGLIYFMRILIGSTSKNRTAGSPLDRPRIVLSWIIFPAVVVLVLSSAATHWPARIRFYLSKSAFEDIVTKAYEGNTPEGFPRRVGLYWVEAVHYDFNYETQQRAIGLVTGVALIDECGIYYDPNDPSSSHWLTTRIAPCWYLTEW